MDAKLKEIKVNGTDDSLKVRMSEASGKLKFSYALEGQYETGEKFTKWIEVARYSAGDWELSLKLRNAQGVAIVQEFADVFNAEIVEWQIAQAAKTLDPNGTLKLCHIEFLYSKVAPVQI